MRTSLSVVNLQTTSKNVHYVSGINKNQVKTYIFVDSLTQTEWTLWTYRSCCWRRAGSSAEVHIHTDSTNILSEPIPRAESPHSPYTTNKHVHLNTVREHAAIQLDDDVTSLYLTLSSYSQLRPVKCFGQAQKLPKMQVPPFLQQVRLCLATGTRKTETSSDVHWYTAAPSCWIYERDTKRPVPTSVFKPNTDRPVTVCRTIRLTAQESLMNERWVRWVQLKPNVWCFSF